MLRSPSFWALISLLAFLSACGGGDGECFIGADCESGTCVGSVCAPVTCNDGVMGEDETDVDCGGSCGGCAIGFQCLVHDDCISESCDNEVCVAAHCNDGEISGDETGLDCGGSCAACAGPSCENEMLDGDETDVDCGGTCSPCNVGGRCEAPSDCRTELCSGEVCVAPGCDNGVLDRSETDADCGGAECDACAAGSACAIDTDCLSGNCRDDGRCAASECEDGLRNGTETDLDCGGDCDGCDTGEMCALGDDCLSGVCDEGVCAPALCDDGVQNGEEVDVDCGGTCDACPTGSMCGAPEDCESRVCSDGTCGSASCFDRSQNGSETDIDCGGSCDACEVGEGCTASSDCTTRVCSAEGRCVAAGCGDGVRNGDETDVDCGGSCGGCAGGGICGTPVDCISRVCTLMACVAETCSDGVRNGTESDIDCGGTSSGSLCPVCLAGESCTEDDQCESGVCTDLTCRAPTCSDATLNGDETDIDCGGSCGDCRDGLRCGGPEDCASGVCTDHICQAPACVDGVRNGDETDVDCGGSCAPCESGSACGTPDDCISGVCTGGSCRAPGCGDGVRNGSETDIDCGGSCSPCVDGLGCGMPSDCISRRCVGGACATPTCEDGVQNGTESDTDCGGSTCDGCPPLDACRVPSDCDADACVDNVCVDGPTASFTISPSSGSAPLMTSVVSSAAAGTGTITSVTYEYGTGSGFVSATSHTFTGSGGFTVRQRVLDSNGLSDIATRNVVVGGGGFNCFLSETDKSPDSIYTLTSDRLAVVAHTLDQGGARSECSVGPLSGVWYMEASIEPWECDRDTSELGCYPTPRGLMNVGLAPGSLSLDGFIGGAGSVGVGTSGSIFSDDEYRGGFDSQSTTTYGFIIDYRSSSPRVLVIADSEWEGPSRIVFDEPIATGAELFAMVGGPRRKVGPQVQFNFGNDTRQRPFHYDPHAVLETYEPAAGMADELVLGFGGTFASPENAPPILSAPAALSASIGSPVMLSANATDAEDGDVTASIQWEDVAETYGERTTGSGGSFVFTPTQPGLHPIRVTAYDRNGQRTQRVVEVQVNGILPTYPTVEMVNTSADPRRGTGVNVSADGLSVQWAIDDKMGLRANEGNLHEFWYFEVERLGGEVNQGAGLVIWDGDLNPYRAENVPPSMSINTSGGIWQNIIYLEPYDTSGTTVYGFAVDYRGINPIVYVIMNDELVHTYTMPDVFVPVHPMLYGNATPDSIPYDETIRFSGFTYDPCAVLEASDIPVSGALEPGWGQVNTGTACP